MSFRKILVAVDESALAAKASELGRTLPFHLLIAA
jgi:hypothetical protein